MNILDNLAILPILNRETYGNNPSVKPNNYCNLVDNGFRVTCLVWEENDEHFRNRIKNLLKENTNEKY